MDFNGDQTVQGAKDSFSANCSKGFKRHQTINKGLEVFELIKLKLSLDKTLIHRLVSFKAL